MSSSAGSRILVVSSTHEQARNLVQRIKDLADSRAGIKPSDAQLTSSSDVQQPTLSSHASEHTSSDGSESIPWTIVNRYYTADVHFETRVLKGLHGHHIKGVPAIVYVFNGSEKYRDQVSDLAKLIQPYGEHIDVSLAVRLSVDAVEKDGAVTTACSVEEEDGLDEFLSGYDFEFVDGDRSGRRPTEDGGGVSDEDPSGVPGLPRVIDSLSTVMWPNMVQTDATKTRKSRARELLDWAREEEEDDGLRALVSAPYDAEDDSGPSSQSIAEIASHKKSRMQREMEELQRWLEEEDHTGSSQKSADHEAWTHADWADMPTTPTINTPYGQESFGFEDDFTDFIGAPIEVQYGSRHDASKVDRLIPMHTGASYQSLASFDEHMFASFHPHTSIVNATENDDVELPSQAEIEETTRRIFGEAFSPSPSSLQVPPSSQSFHSLDSPAVFSTSLAASPSSSTHDIPFDTPDSSFAHDDDDYEMGAFDLSRVLSALQGMKEEISGMQDQDERRKAAARVALGLVYGLQKEEERESVRGPHAAGDV